MEGSVGDWVKVSMEFMKFILAMKDEGRVKICEGKKYKNVMSRSCNKATKGLDI